MFNGAEEFNMDTIGYFLYMEEQEKKQTTKYRSTIFKSQTEEDRPHQRENEE